MKIHKFLIIGCIFTLVAISLRGQGTFQNLNFEAANIPGGTQAGSMVPIASGLPGWNASFISANGSVLLSQVVYDGISLGGNVISIIDTNVGDGFNPLQGKYSPFLFGGPGIPGSTLYAAQISQTGLVPAGTKSLLVDIAGGSFIVSLGGQTLDMVPLQTFPTYVLYGADISSLAGQSLQLALSAPPTGVPNAVELDNIIFSQNSIPEPGTLSLLAWGGLCLGFRCWRQTRK